MAIDESIDAQPAVNPKGNRAVSPAEFKSSLQRQFDSQISIEQAAEFGKTAHLESWVKSLPSNGLDINHIFPSSGHSLLINAARGSDLTSLHLILGSGANINQPGYGGRTPLMHSIITGSPNASALISAANVEIDAGDSAGITAMMYACITGQLQLIDQLLSAGANLNHRSRSGHSPLMCAVLASQLPVVELLCKRGADTKQVDNNGRTATRLATMIQSLAMQNKLRTYEGK